MWVHEIMREKGKSNENISNKQRQKPKTRFGAASHTLFARTATKHSFYVYDCLMSCLHHTSQSKHPKTSGFLFALPFFDDCVVVWQFSLIALFLQHHFFKRLLWQHKLYVSKGVFLSWISEKNCPNLNNILIECMWFFLISCYFFLDRFISCKLAFEWSTLKSTIAALN